MSWRDRYLPATFRGVPFYVDTADTTVGRRTHNHEYPMRDMPYIEDLGRKGREFNVSGYVIGDDYDLARDQLIKATEEFGPGELVHPYKGSLLVNCTALNIRESKDEGGMCRLTFTFVESGEQRSPTSVIDRATSVGFAADSVIGFAISDFVDNLIVSGVPEFVRTAAEEQVTSLLNVLDNISVVGASVEALADYKNTIADLVENVGTKILDKLDMGTTLASLIGQAGEIGNKAIEQLMNISLQPVPTNGTPPTSNQQIAQNNRSAVVAFQSQVSIAEAARVLQAKVFSTYEDAISIRNIVTTQMDNVASIANDNLYTSLQGLRAEIIESVPSPEESLPRLTTFPTADTTASLVGAYELYGSIDLANEIVRRNKVRHPGFISGGRDLEVLTDG